MELNVNENFYQLFDENNAKALVEKCFNLVKSYQNEIEKNRF